MVENPYTGERRNPEGFQIFSLKTKKAQWGSKSTLKTYRKLRVLSEKILILQRNIKYSRNPTALLAAGYNKFHKI